MSIARDGAMLVRSSARQSQETSNLTVGSSNLSEGASVSDFLSEDYRRPPLGDLSHEVSPGNQLATKLADIGPIAAFWGPRICDTEPSLLPGIDVRSSAPT